SHLKNKTPLHPETLFKVLLQLIAEMSTYTHKQRKPDNLPDYQHHDLFNTFQPILDAIQDALTKVLEQNALSIPLQAHHHGLWTGKINDKHLLQNHHFVLAVYADVPSENIRTALPNQIKVAPLEQIKMLVSRALPGIPITSIAVAPRQIPYHANFSYFAIETQHPLWQQMSKSTGIALHVGSTVPGLQFELWAIKG
ncbi:MAG: type VI secretion system baseplate subunit TssK, partial [Gammaproteobacteria bacterium]|nr:type VI secretion system baseplate subunit TssK [Gammaproteobacteria bacterium]